MYNNKYEYSSEEKNKELYDNSNCDGKKWEDGGFL